MVTFRLEHINARDTFVMCMLLFAQSQGAEMKDLNENQEEEGEGEDAEVEADEQDAEDGGACFSSAVGSD